MAGPDDPAPGGADDKRERARDAGAHPDANMPASKESDSVERWGRVLGRTLGWTAAAYLLFFLLRSFAS